MLITDSCHSSTDNVTLHLDGVLYYKVIEPYRVGHVPMYASRKVIFHSDCVIPTVSPESNRSTKCIQHSLLYFAL